MPLAKRLARIWSRTVVVGKCIEWTGAARNEKGYGAIRIDGRKVRLHRWLYAVCVAPIADDVVMRHSCDNTRCIKLQHLEPGTQLQNIAERDARGRTAHTTGPANGNYKHGKRTKEQR